MTRSFNVASRSASGLHVGIRVLALGAFMVAGAAGCTSNCSTDPSQVSRLCAAAYQVGMNDTLESHLGERQAEVDALYAEAEALNLQLSASQEKLAQARLKLLAVDAKTKPARVAAKRLAQEIQLKQMDLDTKLEELGQLQSNLEALKQKKGSKTSLIEDLEKTKVQIRQVKTDISSMNAYLEEDLLIRAENALQYD